MTERMVFCILGAVGLVIMAAATAHGAWAGTNWPLHLCAYVFLAVVVMWGDSLFRYIGYQQRVIASVCEANRKLTEDLNAYKKAADAATRAYREKIEGSRQEWEQAYLNKQEEDYD